MNTQLRLVMAVLLGLSSAAAHALTITASSASIRQTPESGNLYINGETAEYLNIPAAGTYTVTLRAMGNAAGGEYPLMGVSVDGVAASIVSVTNTGSYQDYTFQIPLRAGVHTVGATFQNDGFVGGQDRNLLLQQIVINPPAGVAQPTLSTKAAWESAMQAREQEVVNETAGAIAQHRKGTVTLKVVDASGNPVSGVTVSAVQKTHDFLFGASIAGWDEAPTAATKTAWRTNFEELFNYATVPMFWSLIEPVKGSLNLSFQDAVVSWCTQRNIKMKAHPLLWGLPEALPAWAGGVLPSTTVMQNHVNTLMSRYGASIQAWEVVNEPSHYAGLAIDQPYAWARNMAPNGTLVVNDFDVLYTGHLPLLKQLQDAKANGVPFDAVGIQAHEPRDRAFPLDTVQTVLNLYGTLGKRIHITEFTPVSSGIPVTGATWRGTWTEAQQADYAEKFYRVCFANPNVDAITWWDFSDLYAWNPGGGMLRSDMSAKPVYTALKNLIHGEWKTNASGTSAADGSFTLNGFYGSYEVTLSKGGQTQTVTVNLSKGGAATLNLALSGIAVSAPAAAAAAPIPVSYTGAPSGQTARLWVKKDAGSWVDSGLTNTGTTGTLYFSGVTGNGTYYFDVTTSGSAAGNGKAQTVYSVAPAVSVTVNALATKSTKPVLTGTCANATSVSVVVNGATYAASISNGTWSATVSTALPNGRFNVVATAVNGSTSVTDTTSNELIVDTTAPVITLNGSSTVKVIKGKTYTEQGATANDAIYGNLTSSIQISGTVNTNVIGNYTITYKSVDPLGNQSTKTRTVQVRAS